jgi:hypothetical protein
MSAKLRNSGKKKRIITQCCGPGMFIPIADPKLYPPGSRMSDPGTNNRNKGRVEKLLSCTFLVAKNFTKFKFILFLNWCRKKLEPVDKKL